MDIKERILSETSSMVIVTNPDGKITWVNEAFSGVTGYSLQEIKGKKPGDFLQGKDTDPETVALFSAKLVERETFECEILNYTKTGQPYWAKIKCQPLFDKEGNLENFFSIQENITFQKQAEDEIQTSKKILQIALESSRSAIWQWDIPENKIFAFNFRSMLGYAESDQPVDAYEFYLSIQHPDTIIDWEQTLKKITTQEDVDLSYQERLLTKSGKFIWVMHRIKVIRWGQTGYPTSIIGTTINIEELKETQFKLTESEERWKITLKGSGAGIWEINFNNNTVWYSTKAYQSIGYHSLEEFPKTFDWFLDQIHPEDKQMVIDKFIDHVKGRTDTYFLEHRFRCKNGSYKWFAINGIISSRDANGRAISFMGSSYEITDKKEFERKLLLSEDRLKKALEGSGAGIGEIDLLNNKVWYSKKAAQMLGYSDATELPDGLDFYIKLIHPSDINLAMQKLFDHLNGLTPNFEDEYRLLCKDGSYRWFEFRGVVSAFSKSGKPLSFTGSAYDITDRKMYQEKLRLSEERWKFAIEGANAGIWDMDMQKKEIFWSDKTKDILGIDREDNHFTFEEFEKLIYPPDREFVLQMSQKIAKGEIEKEQIEYRIQKRNREIIWVKDYLMVISKNEAGYASRAVGILFDITERKQLDEKLLESEKRWQFALEGTAHGVWDYNLETGEVFYSEKLKELLGYLPNDEFENSLNTWQSLVHPDDLLKSMEQLQLFLQGKADSYMSEQRAMHRDGTYHWYLNRGIIAGRNKEGVPNRIIGTAEDITERKNIMQELVKAKEIAELSAKSKRFFLANMSHEIRTPMNAILGLSEQLKKTYIKKDQQFLINIISDAAKNMQALINDILDFSKIEEGKMILENIDFNLKDLITRTLNLFLLQIQEKNISLTLDFDPHINEYVKGDPNRLNQALINVIGNAIKFTNEGYVHVSCKLILRSEQQQKILFTISDTGPGISQENLSKIFNDFYQEDQSIARRFGGTGLGLFITKNLIKLMGGEINIESQKDIGTSIYFSLTMELGKVIHIDSQMNGYKIDYEILKGKKVLLVEDNKVNRIVVNIILDKLGVSVQDAENGIQALALLDTNRYDIILMDLQMPQLDGISTTGIIRSRGIKTPIIAITANAVADELEFLLKNGFDDYIVKPFEENKFLGTIQHYLNNPKNTHMSQLITSNENATNKLQRIFSSNAQGNTEMEKSIAQAMAMELTESIEGLTRAISLNDYASIKKVAHKQKSTLFSLGLEDDSHAILFLSSLNVNNCSGPMVIKKADSLIVFFSSLLQDIRLLYPDFQVGH